MASDDSLRLSRTPSEEATLDISTTSSLGDLGPERVAQSGLSLPQSPTSSDANELRYYTTTLYDHIVYRWQVENALEHVKCIYIHLHHALAIINAYGEEALGTPSQMLETFELCWKEGTIMETEVEKAQHSLAAHHTAISECLRKIDTFYCGLPSNRGFSGKRNWFCHDYCTPDAEGPFWGMKRAIANAKGEYECLLPRVVHTIIELTNLLQNREIWKDWHEINVATSWAVVDDSCKNSDTSHSKEEALPMENESYLPEAGNNGDTAYSQKEALRIENEHHQIDDGFLTRPLRALYFNSRICRRVLDWICNFTWNRQLEYNWYHGIERPEDMTEDADEWSEEEAEVQGVEMEAQNMETAQMNPCPEVDNENVDEESQSRRENLEPW